MNKNFYIIVLIILVVILSISLFFKKSTQKETPPAKDITQTETKTEVIESLVLEKPKTRIASSTKDKYGYYTYGDKVYFNDSLANIDIDANSFSSIDSDIIKDANIIYYRDYYNNNTYIPIKNIDPKTFEKVGTCASVEKSRGRYFKNKDHVFKEEYSSAGYNIVPIEYVDVSSFEFLGEFYAIDEVPYSTSYSKDKNNVYSSCGDILKDADTNSFSVLGNGYAKDNSRVWLNGKIIPEADPSDYTVESVKS